VAVGDRLGRWRGGGPGGALARVREAWASVSGDQAARNSIPVRISRAGVVSVACASATWAQELDARSEMLRARLAAALPDVGVAGVRFVIGDHAIPTAAAAPVPRPARPTDDEVATARGWVGDVDDPVLRDLLVRAAAGQLAVRRAQRKSLQKGKTPGRDGRSG
jgi:hypothetical protein